MARSQIQLRLSGSRDGPASFELPPGRPGAAVLFLHTLPGPDNAALARISSELAARGWATLALDCGLAASAARQQALVPADVATAAGWLAGSMDTPVLVLGHGYGGLLALAAIRDIPRVRAVAVINTPAGIRGYSRRATAAAGEFSLDGHALTPPPEALEALDWTQIEPIVERLRHPLLILHAPLDNVVELPNAALLFTAAKHPKSFVSLDSCDHLLSRCAESRHAAAIVCGWAGRYLDEPADAQAEPHATEVTVAEAGDGKFRQLIQSGHHRLVADEPLSAGGEDAGPSPYELLLAALGACTAMTIRMYADMKKLPLRGVSVSLRHEKIHASACQECETQEGRIDRIERVVALDGDLDDATRQRILEIANKCPVHRTLHSEVWVPTRLAE